MTPQEMQSLSVRKQKKKLGMKEYRKFMKENSKKGNAKLRKMRKSGELVLINGKWIKPKTI